MAVRPVESLETLHEVARPVAPAGDRVLAVHDELAALLPDRGLRRGAVAAVTGEAATSLALSLVAVPSREGSWCAVVGAPALGLLAAAEAGIVLERFPLVPHPPKEEWATVVAALLDGFDVVLAWPPHHLREVHARRLRARVRDRGSALVVVGAWPDAADVRLAAGHPVWHGLEQGHGRLVSRTVEVQVTGRGAATRPRRARVSLPLPSPPSREVGPLPGGSSAHDLGGGR